MLLQGRVRDERRSGKVGGTDIGVQAESFSKGEQANLGAKSRVSAPFGSADGAYLECRFERV